jgi:hypothetical protein
MKAVETVPDTINKQYVHELKRVYRQIEIEWFCVSAQS